MKESLLWLGRDVLTEFHNNPPSWAGDRLDVQVVDRDDDGELWVHRFILMADGIKFHVSAVWVVNAMREIVRAGLLGPASQALCAHALSSESYADLDDSERLVSDVVQIAAFGRVRYV